MQAVFAFPESSSVDGAPVALEDPERENNRSIDRPPSSDPIEDQARAISERLYAGMPAVARADDWRQWERLYRRTARRLASGELDPGRFEQAMEAGLRANLRDRRRGAEFFRALRDGAAPDAGPGPTPPPIPAPPPEIVPAAPTPAPPPEIEPAPEYEPTAEDVERAARQAREPTRFGSSRYDFLVELARRPDAIGELALARLESLPRPGPDRGA